MNKEQLIIFALDVMRNYGYVLIETKTASRAQLAFAPPGIMDVVGISPKGRGVRLQFLESTTAQQNLIDAFNATAHGKAALIMSPVDVVAFMLAD